jgi:hypothetical protein
MVAMIHFVHVSTTITYKHVGWSAGFCSHCRQVEALRIEEEIEVTELYFIPINRKFIDRVARCDFCERWVDFPRSLPGIPLAEWSPAEGLDRLFDRLGPFGAVALPEDNAEARLRSLLAATQTASSLTKVDVSPDLLKGGLLGLAAGIPVGTYLYFHQFARAQLDDFQRVLASIGVALLVGAAGGLIGAAVGAVSRPDKVAFRKILAACTKYPVDVHKLEELSHDYSGPVRRAVRAVRETAELAGV